VGVPSLQTLIISNNSFKTVENFPHAAFPCLEVLNVSHNFLNSIGGLDGFRTLLELNISCNSMKKVDQLVVLSLVSLDVSHNRITTVDEVAKLAKCSQLTRFWFNDNPLAQRTSPRIRCLMFIRSLKEMDGRMVSESDLAQVGLLLEANGGEALQVQAQLPPRRVAKVNNVFLAPPLPQLQSQPKRGRMAARHPR
jgi:Leucine-rich repeat (LRR) protein